MRDALRAGPGDPSVCGVPAEEFHAETQRAAETQSRPIRGPGFRTSQAVPAPPAGPLGRSSSLRLCVPLRLCVKPDRRLRGRAAAGGRAGPRRAGRRSGRGGPAGTGPGPVRPRPGISENTGIVRCSLAWSHARRHNAISACRCRDRAIGKERCRQAVWGSSTGASGAWGSGPGGAVRRSRPAGGRRPRGRNPGTGPDRGRAARRRPAGESRRTRRSPRSTRWSAACSARRLRGRSSHETIIPF